MTSTPTSRLRLDKQAPGDNPDAWGERLNAALDMIDEAGGFAEIAVDGNKTLSVVNFASDQARRLVLRFVGPGGYSVTIPAVEKMYYIDNRCSADVVLKTASTPGSSVVAGSKRIAYCDGATVTTDTSTFNPSASSVAFNPTGSLVATNVQAALAELDAEKAPNGSDTTPRFGFIQVGAHQALIYEGEDNSIVLRSGAGTIINPYNYFRFGYDGSVFTNQLGDLNQRIENRAEAYAFERQRQILVSTTGGARRLQIDNTYILVFTVVVTLDGNGDSFISFPWQFPTNCIAVFVTNGDGAVTFGVAATFSPRGLNTNNFTVRGQSASGPMAGATVRLNLYAMGT